MSNKPRFNIGDTVITKVSVRGSYEPSVCSVHDKLTVEEIKRHGNTFLYTCDKWDGYQIKEEDLMSVKEYKESL